MFANKLPTRFDKVYGKHTTLGENFRDYCCYFDFSFYYDSPYGWRSWKSHSMTMTPWIRKFALTSHITASVGWLGSVVVFFVLAVAGITSNDPQLVQSMYISMGVSARYVILPLCFASLITGLIQSLGTPWGLFRHYWVLFKFLITTVSTIILLLHMKPIAYMADAALKATISGDDLRAIRFQLVVDAGAALIALLINIILSVYKPKGLTPYGRRKLNMH